MDKIYRLVTCTKFEKRTDINGWFDFGSTREVGLFDKKEDCVEILEKNIGDICETIYNYAYIEEVEKNIIYPFSGKRDIYKAENVTKPHDDGKEYYNFNLNYVLIHVEKSFLDR